MDLLKKNGVKKADLILIGGLILLSFLALIPFFGDHAAKTVRVTEGEISRRYTLSENRKIELSCGGRVVIEDGGVFVENMPCPDKVCEKCGRIAMANESILCIPNNVSVCILSKDKDLDGISE